MDEYLAGCNIMLHRAQKRRKDSEVVPSRLLTSISHEPVTASNAKQAASHTKDFQKDSTYYSATTAPSLRLMRMKKDRIWVNLNSRRSKSGGEPTHICHVVPKRKCPGSSQEEGAFKLFVVWLRAHRDGILRLGDGLYLAVVDSLPDPFNETDGREPMYLAPWDSMYVLITVKGCWGGKDGGMLLRNEIGTCKRTVNVLVIKLSGRVRM